MESGKGQRVRTVLPRQKRNFWQYYGECLGPFLPTQQSKERGPLIVPMIPAKGASVEVFLMTVMADGMVDAIEAPHDQGPDPYWL